MNVPVGNIEMRQPSEEEQKANALQALCRVLSDYQLQPYGQSMPVFESILAPVKEAIKTAIKGLI